MRRTEIHERASARACDWLKHGVCMLRAVGVAEDFFEARFRLLLWGFTSDRVKLFCIAGGHFLLCRIAFSIFAVHHLLENHRRPSCYAEPEK